jgi:hypothetical protein
MNKPAFNPNQPYEAVNAQPTAKPTFNPSKPFDVADDQYQSESTERLKELGGTVKSLGTGALRGITSGLSDEGIAGISSFLRTLGDQSLSNVQRMFGMEPQQTPPLSQAYQDILQKERGSQQAQQREFPVASTIGDISGTIVQPFNGFKGMVAQGALQGFGRGEGGLEDRATQAGVGAGLGTVGYGIGKVTKAGLSKIFGKEAAGEMAIKQASPRYTDIKHIEQRGLTLSEIGDELLNQKALSSTPENSLNKIQGALQKQNITQKLDDLFTKHNVTVDGNRVLQDLNEIVMDIAQKHPERYSNASKEQLMFLANKLHGQQLQPLELKSLIRNLDKEINWNRQMADESGGALSGAEFLNDIRRAMENNLRTQIAEQAPANISDKYLKANKTYELLSAAEDMFEYQARKSKAGAFFPNGSPLTKIYEAAVYPINTLAPTAAYPMKGARNILEKFPGQQGLNLLGELPTRGQKLQILGDQLIGGQ